MPPVGVEMRKAVASERSRYATGSSSTRRLISAAMIERAEPRAVPRLELGKLAATRQKVEIHRDVTREPEPLGKLNAAQRARTERRLEAVLVDVEAVFNGETEAGRQAVALTWRVARLTSASRS